MAVDLGDVIRLAFTNYSPSGALANSGTMTLTITLPDGSTFSPDTVAPVSTGVYQYDYPTLQAGRHALRWVGTGANPTAHSDAFDVRTATPPYIISVSDGKEQLNIAATVTTHDEEVRLYIAAASLVAERLRGEAIVRRSFTEQQCAYGSIVLSRPSPSISLTSVVSADGLVTWNVADLRVSPAGVVKNKVGLDLYGDIAITYTSGYTIIPEDFGLATRIILQHLWNTQRGKSGAPRTGGMTPEAIASGSGYLVPNQAEELLGAGVGGFA